MPISKKEGLYTSRSHPTINS